MTQRDFRDFDRDFPLPRPCEAAAEDAMSALTPSHAAEIAALKLCSMLTERHPEIRHQRTETAVLDELRLTALALDDFARAAIARAEGSKTP